jgi:short-subunit dehydrogenase
VQNSPAIRLGQEGADGVDLSDKVVVVTGANSGIGKDLATYAAAKGAKIYMFCRSKERAEKAKKEIVDATSSDTVEIILIDLVSRQC